MKKVKKGETGILEVQFQTPAIVADFMANMVPACAKRILEPTAGAGNLVRSLEALGSDLEIVAPANFFEHDHENEKYDCIVMNPPFSRKYAYGVPDGIEHRGMRLGYYILTKCMEMTDNVIALMPWFTISDSDVRLRFLKQYGLRSLTALPRKTF